MSQQSHGKHAGRKRRNVTFNDEEIIINPEDVDPSVGRFRNLVQTTVVPAKRVRFETNQFGMQTNERANSNLAAQHLAQQHQLFQQSLAEIKQQQQATSALSNASSTAAANSATISALYQGLPDVHGVSAKLHSSTDYDITPIAMGTKLGLLLPNPAPDVDLVPEEPLPSVGQKLAAKAKAQHFDNLASENASNEPQKKKYAKEAWPGRNPMLGQL